MTHWLDEHNVPDHRDTKPMQSAHRKFLDLAVDFLDARERALFRESMTKADPDEVSKLAEDVPMPPEVEYTPSQICHEIAASVDEDLAKVGIISVTSPEEVAQLLEHVEGEEKP